MILDFKEKHRKGGGYLKLLDGFKPTFRSLIHNYLNLLIAELKLSENA
jgi:hypothetical protein